jgi:DNA-directed RNA polymerase specialized sigma24 family protein
MDGPDGETVIREGVGDSSSLSDTTWEQADSGADQHRWDELVERFGDLVWSIATAQLRRRDAAAQVCAVTWRRLGDHIHSIPIEAVPSWLRQTAERESLRFLALGQA